MTEAKAATRGRSLLLLLLLIDRGCGLEWRVKWRFCDAVATHPHYYKLSKWIIRALLLVWRCSDTDTNHISLSYIRQSFFKQHLKSFSWEHPYEHTHTKYTQDVGVRSHIVCASDSSAPQLKVRTSQRREECDIGYVCRYTQTAYHP